MLRKILYITLEILVIFLALTAFLGGIMLLANIYPPPVELLQGSPFKDYTIPGLALSLIVGGSALFAAILLFRTSRFAVMSAATSGVIIMFFEFVQVIIIGSPAGASCFMQILYFGLGTLILIVSMGIWYLDILAKPPQ